MKTLLFWSTLLIFILPFSTSALAQAFQQDGISITPIKHATLVVQSKDLTIFVDPVGDQSAFKAFGSPDLILVTDIHRDHLNPDIISALKSPKTQIVINKAGYEQLKAGTVLSNGEKVEIDNIKIEAIPAYNISPDRLNFHPQGRGNGYLLTIANKRIYLSGDTEDIEEMRNLSQIDIALVCMNLPYTMTVEQAASAVLQFKPSVVIPYHYRGKGGMSDIEKFKSLVSANASIKVEFLKWY